MLSWARAFAAPAVYPIEGTVVRDTLTDKKVISVPLLCDPFKHFGLLAQKKQWLLSVEYLLKCFVKWYFLKRMGEELSLARSIWFNGQTGKMKSRLNKQYICFP